MKDFSDFEQYVREHGQEIHTSIHQNVMSAVDRHNFDDLGEEHEFYRRAWVELGIMEMLKHYHEWLNSES